MVFSATAKAKASSQQFTSAWKQAQYIIMDVGEKWMTTC